MPIFDKFTDRARQAMSFAQEEACRDDRQYVGSEHLLCALLRQDEGIAHEACNAMRIRLQDVRSCTQEVVASLPQSSFGGHIPFTARVKHILEQAYRSCLEHQQSYISTEHLLLGICKSGNGIAVEVLNRLGKRPEQLAALVEKLMQAELLERAHENEQTEVRIGPEGFGASRSRGTALEQFSRDLVQLAQDGKLDPVIGRDKEVRRMVQILARRQKNNPLILGDPGVGKTALVEGLAQEIASGNVDATLKDKHVLLLDVASMVAGAKYRGEFEDRIKQVISEVSARDDIILFIDEMHQLIGAGSAEGSLDASTILKPALARGDIQLIGATTAEEYRKYVEKDAAFERRFQPITVAEPSEADALAILQGLRKKYEEHHHVSYTDKALVACVRLSKRYIQDRFLPDKAIDVLDEAGARAHVDSLQLTDEAKKLSEQIAALTKEQQRAADAQDFDRATRLREKITALTTQKEEQQQKALDEQEKTECIVDEEHIARIVSDISGVPVNNLTEDEAQRMLNAEEELHKRLIGQEQAVAGVARVIRRSRSILKDPHRPAGSFIFLGPTGVGKTELAKALAEFLFGSQEALITFDMSEYMEKYAVSKLVGAPPGYVGYEEGGELTKAVRRRPYSVILFDEIEKAHADIFNILLQILDEGRLTDGQGRKIDFSNVVIIMTSNVGAQEISQTAPFGFAPQDTHMQDQEIEKRAKAELKKLFRPEFLNRVDDTIVFHALEKDQLKRIACLMISELDDRLVEQGMTLEMTDDAYDFIVEKGTDIVYGARPLRRAIETHITDQLSEELLQNKWRTGDSIKVIVDKDKLAFVKGDKPIPARRSSLARSTSYTSSVASTPSARGTQTIGAASAN